MGKLIKEFPEEKKRKFADVEAQIKSAMTVNPSGAMTRNQANILTFIETLENQGLQLRARASLIQGVSFDFIKTAIAEGQRYSKAKQKDKGDIL